ncbi:MAG: polysaccharide biosynthesis protein [Bacteroidetes bacterium]|nr:polysaccharide biosynthesis protein [Bacteroidota bacterium]
MLGYIKFEKNFPRWTIFLTDILICLFALFLAYLLRFNFDVPKPYTDSLIYVVPFVIAVRIIVFLLFRTYAGIIQHTSTEDAIRIFVAITTGSAVFILTNLVWSNFTDKNLIPRAIVIIDWFVTIFFLGAFRLLVKVLYFELRTADKKRVKVIIYGAGESGIVTKRTLDADASINYKIIGFVDDDKKLARKKIEGITIYNAQKGFHKLLRDANANLLIISPSKITRDQKKRIVDLCLKYKTKVLNVPPASQWINGELSVNQIRAIRIEDLLGREPIKLDSKEINKQITDKTVLITGAAGSIGSEMARQIMEFKPKKLVLFDQSETAIYELEIEFRNTFHTANYEFVLGDIRNKDRMTNVFETFHPEIIYHAAAYKHVPVMEENPTESVLTNVLGTKITADLAVKHNVQTFVLISTDKAVNPTNVMGASKRIAEIYVQSLDNKLQEQNGKRTTHFITTRFGNVLGSNGSVVQLFRNQIANGTPVTVTHPEVTRYFMTIPEACQLVLEAGAMGKGGEIFIFDMGESIKIVELARKMIELSGLELGKDIQLVFTGLRPGEKLYEELLNNEENTIPTHHPKIMIGKVREYPFGEIEVSIGQLISLFEKQNNDEIVGKMKEIVPEFVSNNSVFQKLDTLERVTQTAESDA